MKRKLNAQGIYRLVAHPEILGLQFMAVHTSFSKNDTNNVQLR